MSENSLESKIRNLINNKTEGNYWDFKREPHKKKDSLLHDILCLSNTKHEGDRFLIIGVADPSDDCEIIGLTENTPKRWKEANLNDFINSKDFAGGNIPTTNIRTLQIDNKEIDVIIIKNNNKKPFYLEKDYESIKAHHIYTRTGDRNTPKDKNASYGDIEYMWEEHFGLHLNVEERFKFYLNDIENWINRLETDEIAIYKKDPKFSIELTEFKNSDYVEPFNTFYLDNSLLYGHILFKYESKTIFKYEYACCDNGEILIPMPQLQSCETKDNETINFYYYNLEENDGLIAKLISKNSFNFKSRIRSFPFIIIENTLMLNEFIEYLKNNIKSTEITANDYFNTKHPNIYYSKVNLESLEYVKELFDKWKLNYKNNLI